MTTLQFILGALVGGLLSFAFFATLLVLATKMTNKKDIEKSLAANAETLALMRERNDLDREKVRHMRAMAANAREVEELHNMQLAAISTATIQNTETTKKDRLMPGNPYWTVAYGDVCRAVDREMAHRAKLEAIGENNIT